MVLIHGTELETGKEKGFLHTFGQNSIEAKGFKKTKHLCRKTCNACKDFFPQNIRDQT